MAQRSIPKEISETAKMAAKSTGVVDIQDVYVLTPKGERELRGAETSLSPAEIELLVLTDGQSRLAEIQKSSRSLSAGAVVEAYGKLVLGGWVKRRGDGEGRDPDVIDFFAGAFPRKPTAKALNQAGREVTAGVATLQKQGYFVSIARRPASRRKTSGELLLSVLVVEDEPILAKFLKQYLAFEGFDVRWAANRAEIVAEFRRPPVPDLVLLDVMLPDADGFDILSKMRSHALLKEVPVIMLTAKATREAVLNGLARGADGYLTKPFEPETLIKAVQTVLGRPGTPSSAGRGAGLKR